MTGQLTFLPAALSGLSCAARRWRRALIACTGAGAAGGGGVAPPRGATPYRSIARIPVTEPVQPVFTESQPVVRETGEFTRTQCVVITSPAVLEGAAAELERSPGGAGAPAAPT